MRTVYAFVVQQCDEVCVILSISESVDVLILALFLHVMDIIAVC